MPGLEPNELKNPAYNSFWAAHSLAFFAQEAIKIPEGRIDLIQRPYLAELYEFPRAEHTVIEKSPQMGLSTVVLIWSIHGCKYELPLGVGYFLPTLTDMRDFANYKVNPILESNPTLKSQEVKSEELDNTRIKRIGRAYLYLRGMKSKASIKSFPADELVFDELDEIEPARREEAIERVSASKVQRITELSNPTLPDYGIDKQFKKSDQRYWHIKCHGCGHENVLTDYFPDCLAEVSEGHVIRICQKCKKEIDYRNGTWIARNPSSKIRGYHFSQLFSATISPLKILTAYKDLVYKDVFYNNKLGLPYIDISEQLKADFLKTLCGSEAPSFPAGMQSTIGIDQGKLLHCVISWPAPDGRRQYLFRVLREFEEIDSLVREYRAFSVIIDAMPETRKARDLQKRFPGRVWLSYYDDNVDNDPKLDNKKGQVNSNRTMTLDVSRDVLLNKMAILPPMSRDVEEFCKHGENLVKVRKQDKMGNIWYEYARTGPDHFRHAQNLDTIAWRFAKIPRARWL